MKVLDLLCAFGRLVGLGVFRKSTPVIGSPVIGKAGVRDFGFWPLFLLVGEAVGYCPTCSMNKPHLAIEGEIDKAGLLKDRWIGLKAYSGKSERCVSDCCDAGCVINLHADRHWRKRHQADQYAGGDDVIDCQHG